MPNLLTLVQLATAAVSLAFGGGVAPTILGVPPHQSGFGTTTSSQPTVASRQTQPTTGPILDGNQPVLVLPAAAGGSIELLSAPADGIADSAGVIAAQTDEPLDGPAAGDTVEPDTEADILDGPVQRIETPDGDDPLDAPLADEDIADDEPTDEEVLDAPLPQPDIADIPAADALDEPPVADADPLDGQVADEVVDLAEPDTEVLDAPLPGEEVAIVPVAPVAAPAPAPVMAAPVAETTTAPPAAEPGMPVSSVRTKGAPADQVVVVAGRRPLPSAISSCDVAVGSGRGTVGVDCDEAPVVAGHQPTISRVPGSAALISAENPTQITSRRDGVQIGEYPEPTFGDSIATTVRAAIFPEDVIVPEILIVPGELVVAGNTSREDPIVLWRSELEAAAAETGIPVEMLATVIRVTSNGDPDADSPEGGVGLMHVPARELAARGISEGQWHDPATNIRIGAQLMANGASPDDVQSGEAVTRYLERSCGADDACDQPPASRVSEWIVYYRLRMTSVADQVQERVTAGTERAPGWPFDDEAGEAGDDPLARLRGDDDEGDRRRPGATARPDEDADDAGWDWPWLPAAEE